MMRLGWGNECLMKLIDKKIQFVMNSKGRKVAVILPLKTYQSLLEDLNDLVVITERRKEKSVTHKQVIAELKRSGYL